LSACVLDTDVVIAALDRRDAHHRAAAATFGRFSEDGVEPLISSVNYAESLVRPAEDEATLRAAIDAIASLGIRVIAPDMATAKSAARFRGLGISLADGFALATAAMHRATVGSFDKRVRRALPQANLHLCEQLQ